MNPGHSYLITTVIENEMQLQIFMATLCKVYTCGKNSKQCAIYLRFGMRDFNAR